VATQMRVWGPDPKTVSLPLARRNRRCARVHCRTVGCRTSLAQHAEPPVRGPGGDQRGTSAVAVARRGRREDLIALVAELLHAHSREQLDAVPACLGLHARRELRPADSVREPRVVVDPLRHTRLPSERAPLDDERVHALAGRVDRCGEPGGPSAQDQEVVPFAVGSTPQPELLRQLLVRGLRECDPSDPEGAPPSTSVQDVKLRSRQAASWSQTK
jgi:hypothetical protein